MAHRHVAFVLRAELAEDRVGLAHVRFALEQFFVRRAHVAGARRADRDHVVEAERFGLRVRAGVEHARDVAVRVVEDRGAAARCRGQLDELDAEFVGQQHRRVEELFARFFGDAAREKPVLAHLRRLGLPLESRALRCVAVIEYGSLQGVENGADFVDLRNGFEEHRRHLAGQRQAQCRTARP